MNIEGTTTLVATVAEVKELLGDRKVTKKGIEEGQYPMVTLATAVVEPTTDEVTKEVAVTTNEESTVADDIKEAIVENSGIPANNIEVIMVTDKVAEPVVEVTEPVANEGTNSNDTTEEVVEPEVIEPVAPVDNGESDEDAKDAKDAKVDAQPNQQESIDRITVAKMALKGFVVGATVGIHDDSMNEELLTAFLDSDIDQAIIKEVSGSGVILAVDSLENTPIMYADLTVLAPPVKAEPKKSGKGGKGAKLVVDPEKDGYPEVGHFATEVDMKKYNKALTNEQLQEWCELEGATWNPHDNLSINRMRMAMAIKAKHFPHLSSGTGSGKSKSKSKYADTTNEQLAQMCLDNDIEVRDAKGDARIERMYMIMDLRNAGIIK